MSFNSVGNWSVSPYFFCGSSYEYSEDLKVVYSRQNVLDISPKNVNLYTLYTKNIKDLSQISTRCFFPYVCCSACCDSLCEVNLVKMSDAHFCHHSTVITIGGHSVRYPWSAISDWAWYRNVRYRTEERRVRHYIGYQNKLLSDIRYPTFTFVNPCSAVESCRIFVMKVMGS